MNSMKCWATTVMSLLILVPSGVLGQTTPKPSSGSQSASATPPVLSHDLSGVWMQYPDGPAPGVPGMMPSMNDSAHP